VNIMECYFRMSEQVVTFKKKELDEHPTETFQVFKCFKFLCECFGNIIESQKTLNECY